MSKLSKFLQKPEKLTLETTDKEKIEFEIHPLTVDELDLLLGLESKDAEVVGNSLKKIVKITLKKAIPDATDSEVSNFPIKKVGKLIDTILRVNKVEMSKEALAKAKQNFKTFGSNAKK